MSSQDNKQLVMQGYQKFQNKDIAGLLELFTDDIEWIGAKAEELPFAGEYHGKNEVSQYFAQLDQAQEAQQFEPQQFIAEGDNVVVTGQARWTVKSTGQTYDNPWVHVFTIRDGKVARFQQYNDSAAAVKAFQPMMGRPQQPGQDASILH